MPGKPQPQIQIEGTRLIGRERITLRRSLATLPTQAQEIFRWYELSIMASGKVALCCMDGEGKHVIGDVRTQSVLEVYNSPGYRKMRQFTFSRKAAAAPCDTCVYF